MNIQGNYYTEMMDVFDVIAGRQTPLDAIVVVGREDAECSHCQSLVDEAVSGGGVCTACASLEELRLWN